MNLYQLLAQNRISPRRAAVLSHICGLLLRTLPQIDADKAAGIIDPTKAVPIDVPRLDEDADSDEEEDSDLDPESDADEAASAKIQSDSGPISENTWDPSLPELDPRKKPS
jgi:hypothetical protein